MIDFTIPIVFIIGSVLTVIAFLIKFYYNNNTMEKQVLKNTERITSLENEVRKIEMMEHEIHTLKSEVEKTDIKISNLTDEIKGIGKSIARLETKIDLLIDKKII